MVHVLVDVSTLRIIERMEANTLTVFADVFNVRQYLDMMGFGAHVALIE